MQDSVQSGVALVLALFLSGCASKTEAPPPTKSTSLAEQSDITVVKAEPGVTPFIASVQLSGQSISRVTSVDFTIAPKPNSVSQAVSVDWAVSALSSRGYLQGSSINLPVAGLYPGYQNSVTFQLAFQDGSTQQIQYQIATAPYTDPTGVYSNPTILKARGASDTLGYNFFILKSLLGPPVIVDTDGQLRWAVPGGDTTAVYFANGQFVTGSETAPTVTLLQLDGTQTTPPTDLPQPFLALFSHNIDPGPNGLLGEFTGTDDLGFSFDDIVSEIDPGSSQPPSQTFDMADIVTTYMRARGDDPGAFVRPGADWFHLNASTYDPIDNTVIISGREDFLIKVNYLTHEIVWIFGDPTKYWYTFPSLRAKALTLDAGGDYPIGQHAVSITSDGDIMVFNNGYGSLNQPPGAPQGVTRTYSEVQAYSVNVAQKTAHQVWKFDYGQSIYSSICGSAYEAGNSFLVDFATADSAQYARLVGLDAGHNVAFDFQYVSPYNCAAAWNAIPIPLESLQIK